MILRSRVQAKGSLSLSHSPSDPSFDLNETPLWYLISQRDQAKNKDSDDTPRDQPLNDNASEISRGLSKTLSTPPDPLQPPDYCLGKSSSDSTLHEDNTSDEVPPLYASSILAIGEVWRKLEMLSPSEPSHRRHWQRLIIVINNTKVEFYKAPKDIKAFVRKLADVRRARAEGKEPLSHSGSSGCVYNEHGICHPSLSDMLTKKPKCHTYFSAQTIRDHYQLSTCPREVEELSRCFCLVEDNLIRSYTLQYAQIGLANDYKKRTNVVRMRAEGEQFLLYCASSRQCVDLVHDIFNGIDLALPLEDRVLPVYRTIPRRRRRRRHAHHRYHQAEDPANLRNDPNVTIHNDIAAQERQQQQACLQPIRSDPESVTVLNCILTKWSSLDTFHQVRLLQVLQNRHGLKNNTGHSIETSASGNDVRALTEILRGLLSVTDSLEIKDSQDNSRNGLKARINPALASTSDGASVCQLSGSVSDTEISTPTSVPTPSSSLSISSHAPKMERGNAVGQNMEDYFNHHVSSLSIASVIPECPDERMELNSPTGNGCLISHASSDSINDDFTPSSFAEHHEYHSDSDEEGHLDALPNGVVDENHIYAEIDTDSENELDDGHHQSPTENHETISECDDVHQTSILDYILQLEERLIYSSFDSSSDSSGTGSRPSMEKWIPTHHASQADNVIIKYAKDCLPSLPATASWKTTLLLREAPPLATQTKGFLRGGLSSLVHGSSSPPNSGISTPTSQPVSSTPGGFGLRRRASSILSGLSVSSNSRRSSNGRSNDDIITVGLSQNSSTSSLSQDMSSHSHLGHHWIHSDNKHRQLGSEFTTTASQSFIRHVTKTTRLGI